MIDIVIDCPAEKERMRVANKNQILGIETLMPPHKEWYA